ncbi:MAG: Type 1 glutamine amidotransferase-like domain-containing protein [Actinomycetota bacterium]
MTTVTKAQGTLALLGGGEWQEPCRALDASLLAAADTDEVLILPAAAAFEHPERVIDRAAAWFETLGARVAPLAVLNRRDAERDDVVRAVESCRFLYIADGSPLHLRSVLKGSACYDALATAVVEGAVVAASGAGATVVCDPMVDPRGGAYTVGLGLVRGMAVFPYHGTAASHLRERSIELLPADAVLAGIDEHTALVRRGVDDWRVAGRGAVTFYRRGGDVEVGRAGDQVSVMVTANM